jgi:hypothetical protein
LNITGGGESLVESFDVVEQGLIIEAPFVEFAVVEIVQPVILVDDAILKDELAATSGQPLLYQLAVQTFPTAALLTVVLAVTEYLHKGES